MSRSKDKSHYSYSIYADAETAGRFDDSHFGGAIGRMIVEKQERVLFDFSGDLHSTSVLDVGTGTGRAALAMRRVGARVMGMDASREMLKVAQARAAEGQLEVQFLPGDAHALPFADRSFDAVVSLRMLMHTPDWRRCIAEMCRVARHRVIIDYPPLVSFAALQTMMRRIARYAGRRVETYHVIPTGGVRKVLSENGFMIAQMNRQFVLPIALHKFIASPRFSASSEHVLDAMGLLNLMGSPVTILAERRER